jgi:hypothetical protein
VTSIIKELPRWRNRPTRMALLTLAEQVEIRLNAFVQTSWKRRNPMKKYVIERGVPGIGAMDQKGFSEVAHQSNGALEKLKPRPVAGELCHRR